MIEILIQKNDLRSNQGKHCGNVSDSSQTKFKGSGNRIRKLKVHAKYQRRKNNYVLIPEIRLAGKWLGELGFEIGREVIVSG